MSVHVFGCFDEFLILQSIIFMCPSSLELNSDDFPFFKHLDWTSGSRDRCWKRLIILIIKIVIIIIRYDGF